MKTPANSILHGHVCTSKRTVALFFGCIISLILVNRSVAQQTGTLPEVTIKSNSVQVNERVLKVFNKAFKETQNPRWFLVEKRYLVKHRLNDMAHNTLYGRRGRLIYDIGYGAERNLPDKVKAQVKDNYKNFGITLAVNVNQDLHNVWKINLENERNIIFLHAEDGMLVEQGRVDKSSDMSTAANQSQSLDRLLSQVK